MPQNPSEWNVVADDNTNVNGINIAEGWAAANCNNAIRAIMASIKGFLSPLQPLGDLSALDEETTPADDDLLLLEKDSDGSKKKVKVENISTGGKLIGEVYVLAGGDIPDDSLECKGETLDSVADTEYADLFARIGTTWGGTGANAFAIPNLYSDGRFIRSRTASVAVGTTQADAYLNHNHSASSNSTGGHFHRTGVLAGTEGNAIYNAEGSDGSDGSGLVASGSGTATKWLGKTNTNSNHSHTITVSNSTTGSTETRPKNASFIVCIKVI